MELTPQATATPLRAQPVYITIVPGSMILSGYAENEGAEIHRLSKTVLRLAVVNCLLAYTIRLIALVVAFLYGWYSQIFGYLVDIAFATLVLYLGVQGVRTRNDLCCGCCCGYLTGFFLVYLFLAVMEAIYFLIAVIQGYVLIAIISFAFLCLYCVTAEQSRRLLDVLATVPRDPPSTTTSVVHSQPTVAVAEATDVRIVSSDERSDDDPPDKSSSEDLPPPPGDVNRV